MFYTIGSITFMCSLWLILSGHYEAWLLLLGFASVFFVSCIASKMHISDHEGFPSHLAFKSLLYFPWLTKEIITSNFTVAKAILTNKIDPQLVSITTTQDNDLGRTILANSVTLTPGTISIDLENNCLEIHALLTKSASSVKNGEMDNRVSKMTNSFKNNNI